MIWLSFAVIYFFIPATLSNCEYNIFSSCNCGVIDYLGKDQYVLNCTNTGFTNVSVLSCIPDETQVLIFTGNDIPELPWNLFGINKNLSQLRVIDLSNNNIKVIYGKSFHHVSSVQRLILNHNQISISFYGDTNTHHPRLFSNFEQLVELHLTEAFAPQDTLIENLHDIFIKSELKLLRKLHLEQNGIKSFKDTRIFCDLPSLMDIYLANNKLEGLDFDIVCLPHLRFIDLEKNYIESITEKDMEKMDEVSRRGINLTLDLGGNPLRCGDDLHAFFSWLECASVHVRNRGKLKCIPSAGSNRSCHITVSPPFCGQQKLFSHPSTSAASYSTTLIIAFLLSLSINLYFIYRYKFPNDPIRQWYMGLSQTLSSSVHYTKQSNLDDI